MGDNLYIYYEENVDKSTPITIRGWDSTEDHNLHIMVDREVVEYDPELHGSWLEYVFHPARVNRRKKYVRLKDGEWDYPNIFRRLRSGEWEFLAHQLWNDFLEEGSREQEWLAPWLRQRLSKNDE